MGIIWNHQSIQDWNGILYAYALNIDSYFLPELLWTDYYILETTQEHCPYFQRTSLDFLNSILDLRRFSLEYVTKIWSMSFGMMFDILQASNQSFVLKLLIYCIVQHTVFGIVSEFTHPVISVPRYCQGFYSVVLGSIGQPFINEICQTLRPVLLNKKVNIFQHQWLVLCISNRTDTNPQNSFCTI